MVLNDPESSPPEGPLSGAEENAARLARTKSERSPGVSSRLMIIACVAALVAGTCSLVAGEIVLRRYERELLPVLKIRPSAEDLGRFRNARIHSAVLTYTAMGAFLGLAMGLAGGLDRRSVAVSARGAIVGLVAGSAGTAAVGFVVVSNFFKMHDPQSGDLLLPLISHGAIWSTIGMIGGLALGLGLADLARWKATLVGGLVGAAAATIIYEFVGALFFASNKTDLPVSSSIVTRALAQFLVAVFTAVGAVLASRSSPTSAAAPLESI
jgi:hypothetical protein